MTCFSRSIFFKNPLKISFLLLLGLSINSAFAELNSSADASSSSGSNSGSNSGWASGFVIQAGAFSATQGDAQHVDIKGLVGDDFSVNKNTAQNFLLGLGYYFNGMSTQKFNLLYGVNAFYLAPTKVKGDVLQEGLFTNLSYEYSIENYPVYLSGKALVHLNPRYDISFDLGVGPNFIKTSGFSEASLDNGLAIPDDNIFTGETQVVLSGTAGVGLRINNLIAQKWPLELDYRFFYLGQGELKAGNNQVMDNLKTGNNYANAIFVSLCF